MQNGSHLPLAAVDHPEDRELVQEKGRGEPGAPRGALEELQQVMRMPMPVHDRSSNLSDSSSTRRSYDRSASAESLARMEFQQGGHSDSQEAQGKSLKQLSSIQES